MIESTTPEIDTPAALRIAGVDKMTWRCAMDRGNYSVAPPLVRHDRRLWRVDDIVALRFFQQLKDRGMPASHAGSLATCLAGAMIENPHAGWLTIYQVQRARGGVKEVSIGTDPPAPSATVLMHLPVDDYREQVRQLIRLHFLATNAASDESPGYPDGTRAGRAAKVASAARTNPWRRSKATRLAPNSPRPATHRERK